MANISLRHVCKTFHNGVVAVRDCTLEAAEGEFLVVAGPEGSGKSTLFRLIAGLETPTEGDIYIGGGETRTMHEIAEIIKELRESYPGIHFHLYSEC